LVPNYFADRPRVRVQSSLARFGDLHAPDFHAYYFRQLFANAAIAASRVGS
jgi:hypothetical protein